MKSNEMFIMDEKGYSYSTQANEDFEPLFLMGRHWGLINLEMNELKR